MSKDANQLIKNRHIRLFISSTFEDMQNERNYLMRRTFPELQLIAAQRDVMLTAIDLRWGISKEEAENGKVVDACFREIENSVPFFLGIIGNRYGWCPATSEIDSNTKLRYPQVRKLLGLSMTEMEIQFAVLNRKRKMHAVFFIRNTEKDYNQYSITEEKDKMEKLAHLKESLLKNNRYPVLHYSNEEELSYKVKETFVSLLNELYKEKQPISTITKDRIRQKMFKKQLCRCYIKDEQHFSFLNNWLYTKKQRQLVVVGDSGVGKSALLANWVNELELSNYSEWKIIYHFIGNGGCQGDYKQIQLILYEEIISSLGKKKNYKREDNILYDAFDLVASRQDIKLLLVLDGVNQLADEDSKFLAWIPTPPNNMRIVYSSQERDKTYLLFKKRKYPKFRINPIVDRCFKELIIKKYLGHFAKNLSTSQQERIILDSKCNNTLVLISLLNILVCFCTYENIDTTLDYFLQSNTIEDYYRALIQKYEKEFDNDVQTKGLVRKTLSLILVSRNGISETDLMQITKTPPYYWSQFYSSFIRNFTTGNGLVSFSHQYILNAVKNLYCPNAKKKKKYQKKLILYRVKRDDKYSWTELPYQYHNLNEHVNLFNYLCQFHVFKYLYENDRISLIKYWKTLNRINFLSFGKFVSTIEDKAGNINFMGLMQLWDFCNNELNLYDEAARIAEIAREGANSLSEREILYNKLDVAYSNCGKYEEALHYSKLHLDYSIKLYGYRSEETITAFSNLAQSHMDLQNDRDSIYLFFNAIRLVKSLYGITSEKLVSLYNSVSSIFRRYDDYYLSEEYYNAALEIEKLLIQEYVSKTRCYDEFDLGCADSFEKIASYYSNSRNYKKAISYYKKELGILQNIYGSYHHRIANIHSVLADVYMLANYDNKRSFNECFKALSIIKYLLGERNIDYINCLAKLGQYTEGASSLQFYQMAYETSLDLLGNSNQLTLDLCSEIAHYYAQKRDFQLAMQYYDKIVKSHKPQPNTSSSFFLQITTWRLICANKAFLQSITNEILSAVRDMPDYVAEYQKRKGSKFFADLRKRDIFVRKMIKRHSLNNDIYISYIYMDYILLQDCKSNVRMEKEKYAFRIGLKLDSKRWSISRVSGVSFELISGTNMQIRQYVKSLNDETIEDIIIGDFEHIIEKYFYGEE